MHVAPYRLRTFGGLAIERGDVRDAERLPPLALNQRRKSLALLAVLAAEAEVSRDRLLALFWAESDTERARNALYQALHGIRQELGDASVTGAGALRLDPSVVTSDVGAFRACVQARDFDGAARLYAGEFLAGVFVRDAAEFERWVDDTRTGLRAAAEFALESLAREASSRGDLRTAVTHWRRLTELAPTSSRAATGLIQALSAAGDHTAALDFARTHETLLRAELDAPPSPEVQALARRLRSGAAGHDADSQLALVRATLAPRYEVRERVRRGTLTNDYAAFEPGAGRAVLLKVVHAPICEALAVNRFLETLRALLPLRHDRLIELLDAATVGDVTFYVVPAVAGESLRERLVRERRLRVREAAALAADAAGALAALHAAGVVHRDVKPRHLVCANGGAMLAESGVAAALHAAGVNDATMSGAVALGTPAYMSPEHVSDSRVLDARSDVYSLGCVLYHLLTGEPPFAAGDAHTLPARRLADPLTPPRALRAEIPAGLEELLLRMLAREPDARIARATDVREALRAFASD